MRIAAIGTGNIVETFLEAVSVVEDAECVSVLSRTAETGRAAAEKFSVGRFDTRIDEVLRNPDVDFVYIASPNSLHYAYAREALLCGKNVICEKPFTSTLREAEELALLAREKKLFLFEAVSTIYLPAFLLLKERLNDIGKIRLVQCSFCQYSARYDILKSGGLPNVFNPEFSGGALMDLNVYNLHFIMRLLGTPDEAVYFPQRHENGIDLAGVLILRYPEILCECAAAKNVHAVNSVQIHGEEGCIHIPAAVSRFGAFSVFTKDQEREYNLRETGNPLCHEVASFRDMFASGDLSRCYGLLDHSLGVMKIVHEARLKSGVAFSADTRTPKL